MRLTMMLLAAMGLAGCALGAETTAPESVAVEAPSGEYALDPTHASVTVRVSHFGLSNYTLRFNNLNASLNFNAENPRLSTITASVATNSIETDHPGPRDFDAELQSADWLDAGAHPLASFRSAAVVMTGPNSGRMTGELNLHGVTRPVAFDVVYNHSYARHPFGRPISQLGFSARGVIRRSDFGITQFLPEPGTQAGVGDDVELVIEAEFVRPIAG